LKRGVRRSFRPLNSVRAEEGGAIAAVNRSLRPGCRFQTLPVGVLVERTSRLVLLAKMETATAALA
jgi:hypothetical protein